MKISRPALGLGAAVAAFAVTAVLSNAEARVCRINGYLAYCGDRYSYSYRAPQVGQTLPRAATRLGNNPNNQGRNFRAARQGAPAMRGMGRRR
jgi:hypothetical protein